MGFFLVLKAELVRTFIIMRRYWFATLTSLIIGYGMLMGLILGFMARRDQVNEIIDNRFGVDPSSATNAALGLIIGSFAFGIIGIFSQGLQNMARSGQLEQLCLSPHGLVTNFLARSFVGSVASIFTSSIVLFLVARSVEGRIHADPLPTVALLLLTYVDLIGFGFMLGGLVLLFKQTGQVAVIVRIALLGLAVWATDRVETGYAILDLLVHVLPVTDAAICLKHVLIRGQILAETGQFASVFELSSFYYLVINSVVWTAIGITVFKWMENWSRDKGTLGSY